MLNIGNCNKVIRNVTSTDDLALLVALKYDMSTIIRLVRSKQSSIPGHVFSTWMAFGGNTRDLDHLEKKQTRLRLYTKYLEEPHIQSMETA
ncbi:hypothetical protein Tco_0969453 [Tanacetum coccineum]